MPTHKCSTACHFLSCNVRHSSKHHQTSTDLFVTVASSISTQTNTSPSTLSALLLAFTVLELKQLATSLEKVLEMLESFSQVATSGSLAERPAHSGCNTSHAPCRPKLTLFHWSQERQDDQQKNSGHTLTSVRRLSWAQPGLMTLPR